MLKKVLLLMLVFVGTVSLASCEATSEKTNLSVFFVPSRDNATLVQGISYLPTYLKAELAEFLNVSDKGSTKQLRQEIRDRVLWQARRLYGN